MSECTAGLFLPTKNTFQIFMTSYHTTSCNILTSREAVDFTDTKSPTKPSKGTIEKLQNKQSLKRFQTSYAGFQIQGRVKLHLCDTQPHTLLLGLTSVMTLHKRFTFTNDKLSQVQQHSQRSVTAHRPARECPVFPLLLKLSLNLPKKLILVQ